MNNTFLNKMLLSTMALNKNRMAVIGIVALAVLVTAYVILLADMRGTDMYNKNASRRISATEAREMMRRNPNAIILDVRTTQEFSTGRVKGAISLPDYAIRDRAGTVIPGYDALVLVYCRSGNRSRAAMYDLLSMGYTNVYDFGGITSWPYETE